MFCEGLEVPHEQPLQKLPAFHPQQSLPSSSCSISDVNGQAEVTACSVTSMPTVLTGWEGKVILVSEEPMSYQSERVTWSGRGRSQCWLVGRSYANTSCFSLFKELARIEDASVFFKMILVSDK